MDKSPLNKLPREIRDEIYKLVMMIDWKWENNMPLLHTCMQIKEEAMKFHTRQFIEDMNELAEKAKRV